MIVETCPAYDPGNFPQSLLRPRGWADHYLSITMIG
jgi:hypothetical protein